MIDSGLAGEQRSDMTLAAGHDARVLSRGDISLRLSLFVGDFRRQAGNHVE